MERIDYRVTVYGLQDSVRDFARTHGEPSLQADYLIIREKVGCELTITPIAFNVITKITMEELEPVVEAPESVENVTSEEAVVVEAPAEEPAPESV